MNGELNFFELFLGSIRLRPYVFLFLAFYLLLAWRFLGGQRLLLFTALAWGIALLSEVSSIHNGFPYGLYHYTGSTRGQELFFGNIPFFTSLSYTFLQFFAFNTALFLLFPHAGGNLQLPSRFSNRIGIALLAALLVTYLDIIIDPVAHQGEKWFLGRIYYYANPGAYFAVPMSNFAGWFFVGLLSVGSYLWLERFLPPRPPEKRNYRLPFGDRAVFFLFFGVIAFNMAVTAWVEDKHLLLTDLLIVILPTTFGVMLYRRNRVDKPTTTR